MVSSGDVGLSDHATVGGPPFSGLSATFLLADDRGRNLPRVFPGVTTVWKGGGRRPS
jgi:hypothetical protein